MGKKEGITKEIVLSYKRSLIEEYAPSSVNSMLASLNIFFKVNHWYECIVKSLKIQQRTFRAKEKRTDKRRILQIIAGGTKRRKISFVLYSSDNMQEAESVSVN